ncbi:MAG: two-component sensor histidine kinase [Elusimicrobiota bacterium]|jgi:signal transduction histidine kinase|nr:two-component sensor histidine kinase [Elusimicrobiota bacterium]
MRKLEVNLSISIMLIVLITVALISFLSNIMIGRQFKTYVTDIQKIKALDIADNVSQYYNPLTKSWNIDSIHTIGMYALQEGYIIKVYDNDNEEVWDAQNHDMSLCHRIIGEISQRMNAHGVEGEFIKRSYQLIAQDGQNAGLAEISYFGPFFLLERDFSFLKSLNIILIFVGILSLLFAFLTGRILAKRIADPISKVSDIAIQISKGKYDIEFKDKTTTQELHNLIFAVNHLAKELSKQENLRSRLTADISHELRTPLAVISSHLEAMIEKVWQPTPERLKSLYEEILRLTALVCDLERLEKLENDNLKLNKTQIDLLQLVRAVCANFESALVSRNLKFSIEGQSSIVNIDKDRFASVLTNLMSNAVKYTAQSGEIRIFVKDLPDSASFIIENEAEPIPESELPSIFERFYRADKSRNRNTGGAGIGLAIAKSIIIAHNATIAVQNIKTPKAIRFTITIPKS